MSEFVKVGTRRVKNDPKSNISLYEVVQSDMPEKFYRSVFISRNGDVSIEEYDGNYDAAGGNDKDKFPELRQKIITQIVEVYPLLEDAEYFKEGTIATITADHIPFNFYTSPYGHLYDAIYVDSEFNFLDTMLKF